MAGFGDLEALGPCDYEIFGDYEVLVVIIAPVSPFLGQRRSDPISSVGSGTAIFSQAEGDRSIASYGW